MPELSKNDRVLAQRALNEITSSQLNTDGVFGPMTKRAIAKLCQQYAMPVVEEINDNVWAILSAHIADRFIRNDDIIAAARSVGVLPSIVFALYQVESIGVGSLPDGRPVILFERHKFYQFVKSRLGERTAEEWKSKYPNLCHPTWSQSAYKGEEGEWTRLEQARTLDATCALMSASWGLFQIMGFNFALAGYKDVQSFVEAMIASERNHLNAVVMFIKNQPAFFNALKSRDYNTIARLYNGPAYATHGYHTRLRNADQLNLQFNNQ